MRNLKIAALAVGLLLPAVLPGLALADGPECRANAQAADGQRLGNGLPLSAAALTSQLEQKGYTSITKLEIERGCFEARASDKDGGKYRLKGDAYTGDIQSMRKW